MIEQGHFFNRMWTDHGKRPAYKAKRNYVPCQQREGFDEAKVVHLNPGETGRKSK